MARKASSPVLGKFPKSKLAVLAGSLASLGMMSGVLAMPRQSADQDAPVVTEVLAPPAAPAETSQPAPQIIRRVYVIRRSQVGGAAAQPAQLAPAAAPAAGGPPQSAPAAAPAQPAAVPAPPTAQPVTKSRGS